MKQETFEAQAKAVLVAFENDNAKEGRRLLSRLMTKAGPKLQAKHLESYSNTAELKSVVNKHGRQRDKNIFDGTHTFERRKRKPVEKKASSPAKKKGGKKDTSRRRRRRKPRKPRNHGPRGYAYRTSDAENGTVRYVFVGIETEGLSPETGVEMTEDTVTLVVGGDDVDRVETFFTALKDCAMDVLTETNDQLSGDHFVLRAWLSALVYRHCLDRMGKYDSTGMTLHDWWPETVVIMAFPGKHYESEQADAARDAWSD